MSDLDIKFEFIYRSDHLCIITVLVKNQYLSVLVTYLNSPFQMSNITKCCEHFLGILFSSINKGLKLINT